MNTKILIIALATLALPSIRGRAEAIGTEFTYQGRLTDVAGPSSGAYDFTFTLHLAASGGVPIVTVTNLNTPVSNGLFTATVDFGGGIYNGNAYWISLGVRSNGTVSFTTLTPRQPLSPTPNASYASLAGTVPGGSITSAKLAVDSVTISALQNGAVTAAKVAAGQLVKSVNGLRDDVVLAAGPNVTITPSGNTLTVAGSSGWGLGGNAGTTPGVNFLGTADNQALQLKVNNAIALQFTPGVRVPNIVGGLAAFLPSVIASGVSGAVIAGGNAPSGGVTGYGGGDFQAVYDNDGTVGGGFGNKVGTDNGDVTDASFATVAGGVFNTAMSYAATVAGGDSNLADGQRAAVLGGLGNRAGGAASTVGGGLNNQATGSRSTIGGGQSNLATNTHSAVAGGGWNTASGVSSFIGGGGGDTFGGPWPNTAGGDWSAILGGWNNIASGYSSVVGGGANNISGGLYTVVPGGSGNVASNYASFAAGLNAHAVHGNSFVWSDANGFSSTGPNQFAVRANGGVRIGTVITPDSQAALDQVVIGPSGTTNSALRLGFHVYNGISGGGVIQATDGGPVALELNPMGGGGYLGGDWAASGNFSAPALDVYGAARIQGGNNWNVTGGEGDFRVGNASYRFKIGVANGGGGAGDVWMRAHGGTQRVFIKTPGGTTFYSNEGETAGVSLAANGTSWATVSDRNVKKDFAPVDQRTILEKLAALPITQWHYKWESPEVTPHIGPMAQDFKAAFYPGTDDKSITTQEADGVALVAIQGLNQKVEDLSGELKRRDMENAELKQRLEKLERLINHENRGAK
ncbi:MAG: tail fiber domain-containing protein [Verrucomicrobia bacterium]|nr:tail fiber domain-containing protein [Verrucomicrobiota bacterium]